MTFSYVLAGWEGSAHDGRVLDARRYPILVTMPSFYFPFQCVLVNYCFLIHNFIRRNQLYEDDFYVDDDVADANDDDNLDPDVGLVSPAGQLLKQWRTDIAENMWLAYNEHLARN